MLERKHDTFTYLDYYTGPTEGAPLLVMLHGYGSNERDLISLAPALDRRLRVLSIQAPTHMGYEMYGWFPIEFTPCGIAVDREAAGKAAKRLGEFLRETIEKLRPAGGKLFLMGFSQGAVMSYLTAFSSPELLHGVIALSGQLPDTLPAPDELSAELKNLPFLVIHGLNDDVLPIDKGREADRWLAGNVSDHTFREYPMGHEIDSEALALITGWVKQRVDTVVG